MQARNFNCWNDNINYFHFKFDVNNKNRRCKIGIQKKNSHYSNFLKLDGDERMETSFNEEKKNPELKNNIKVIKILQYGNIKEKWYVDK